MTQLKLFKTIILWGLIIGIFFSGCSVWFFQKNDHLQSKLPKERILANDIQNRIEHTITEALRNVLNRSTCREESEGAYRHGKRSKAASRAEAS